MKAISLWQPWASLMGAEIKFNETRGRLTHHRGDLAICSTQRKPRADEISTHLAQLIWANRHKLEYCSYSRAAFFMNDVQAVLDILPLGHVLCVVDVFGCKSTSDLVNSGRLSSSENVCGNYEPGRFAWQTGHCRQLKTPVPVVGRQGFFNLPADIKSKVLEQI